MTIAVASGKGGTGKTTVATNLTVALAREGLDVAYVDCDVEEPNGHIFLQPTVDREEEARVAIPSIDPDICTGCGECSDFCQYNALAVLGPSVMLFPELCHSCGGCRLVCPEKAITEIPKTVGRVRTGTSHEAGFIDGTLEVGATQIHPVTSLVRRTVGSHQCAVIDAPPGTTCPTIEAVRDVDYVVLVTEPTPFGLNDLELAVGMVRELGLRFGVVINRSDIGDDRVETFCIRENIPVLLSIPYDLECARAYAGGHLAIDRSETFRHMMVDLYHRVEEGAHD
ncbi:MAG: ATP-binding protein [candidate division Zixibacteria bacterium]|nr:ATP-binding protein [candidate division Zixibacteria bacterium]